MELTEVKLNQRVQYETDNNGPILRGVVAAVDGERGVIDVKLDGEGYVRWFRPRELQPE